MHILQRCQSSEDLPLPGNHLNPVKNRIIVLPGISANRETVWEFGQPFSKTGLEQREIATELMYFGHGENHLQGGGSFLEELTPVHPVQCRLCIKLTTRLQDYNP